MDAKNATLIAGGFGIGDGIVLEGSGGHVDEWTARSVVFFFVADHENQVFLAVVEDQLGFFIFLLEVVIF